MNQQELLTSIISELEFDKVKDFLRIKSKFFSEDDTKFPEYKDNDFDEIERIGSFDFDTFNKIVVFKLRINRNLSEKTSKKLQYDKAKYILKQSNGLKGGLFFFYDIEGNFRLSLVYEILDGNRRSFNLYKRFTFFVNKGDDKQKTFIQQIGKGSFDSFSDIKEAFSVDKLSDEFYNSFEPKFTKICNSVKERTGREHFVEDFVLLFVIRIIFLGFIQKRKWISENEKFLHEFWNKYKNNHYNEDKFYKEWLSPLFFEALNGPPGSKEFGEYSFPEEYKTIFKNAPYLNGGLFRRHDEVDNKGFFLLDKEFEEIFDYIYSYNFTIEENTLYDHELELNPEFLGIIFEKLVNKEQGAVYTPRPEVSFMGRLTLAKWLFNNNTESIELRDLYQLFFDEIGTDTNKEEYEKRGSFSRRQIKHILDLLEDIKICDPACGSGAFLVGMLQIIDEVEEYLRKELGGEYLLDSFERRKRIIFSSLFGVEVKEWAVWIAQLRLWITLFIEAPDSLRNSKEPILPNLEFKVRKGDSLLQRIGTQIVSIKKPEGLGTKIIQEINDLIEIKQEYFENKILGKDSREIVEKKEREFFAHFLKVDIDRIEKEIQKYENAMIANESQGSLFMQSSVKIEFDKKDIKEKLKSLKTERGDFISQLDVAHKQNSLVWIIEFADVFANPNKEGFDIVIGNPPYLRQEDIKDPYEKIQGYKDLLIDSIKGDFPRYFKDKKINKRSDLYTYFYVRSLALLNPRGLLTFICENSWLDVNYGVWLQEFILNNAHLDLVIDNQAEKSFKEDVNTIITIMESTPREKGKDLVRFVNFKKPFEEVLFTEKLLYVEETKGNTRNEDFSIKVISKEELKEEGLELPANNLDVKVYVGDKWGSKYIKAPDIFLNLFQRGELTSLGNYADVRAGCYSGLNDFFYIDQHVVKMWDIEDEYVLPFIRNARGVNSYVVNYPLHTCILNVEAEKKEFLRKGVKNYIDWGEKQKTRKRQKTKAGILWNKTESVKSRRFWYSIPSQNLETTNLFLQYVSSDRFYAIYTIDNLTSDRAFHRVFPNKNIDASKLFLSLNSTLSILSAFVWGRQNLGGGALKIETSDAKKLPIPNPNIFEDDIIEDLLMMFSKHKPESIFVELGFDSKKEIRKQEPKPLEYRKTLDKILFNAYDLSKEEINEIYWSVAELLAQRLKKAKSK